MNVTSKRVNIYGARLSFPNLFKKGSFNGLENAKFDTILILNKDSKNEIEEVVKSFDLPAHITPLKCGKLKEKYEGFAGNHFIVANNRDEIEKYDENGERVYEDNGKFIAGCYVTAQLNLWVCTKPKKLIVCDLLAIGFENAGRAFGKPEVDRSIFMKKPQVSAEQALNL